MLTIKKIELHRTAVPAISPAQERSFNRGGLSRAA